MRYIFLLICLHVGRKVKKQYFKPGLTNSILIDVDVEDVWWTSVGIALVDVGVALVNVKMVLVNVKIALVNVKIALVSVEIVLVNVEISLVSVGIALVNVEIALVNFDIFCFFDFFVAACIALC